MKYYMIKLYRRNSKTEDIAKSEYIMEGDTPVAFMKSDYALGIANIVTSTLNRNTTAYWTFEIVEGDAI